MAIHIPTKWVRVQKGDGVRCRLVGMEFGHGKKLDELFAGIPSLMAANVLLALFCSNPQEIHERRGDGVGCEISILVWEMDMLVYIDLPEQDPRYHEH